MFNIRWQLSVWLWALWLKVTPECTGKEDILHAVAGATIRKARSLSDKAILESRND